MSGNTTLAERLWHYTPSIAAAAVFAVLFTVTTFLHLYQLIRTKVWYMIPLFIGGLFELLGYCGRIWAHEQAPNYQVSSYVMQSLLLLVAPALLAASIYMMLGRIILATDGESYALIKRRWSTKLFVIGDVFSFLIVSSGAGLQVRSSSPNSKIGPNLVIAGLVIQILFFGFFIIFAAVFHLRMRKLPTQRVRTDEIPWQRHLFALYFASILIFIRSVIRVIEYAQGDYGYIFSHEIFLYIFDALLMFGVCAVFNLLHPSQIQAIIRGDGHYSSKGGMRLEIMEVPSHGSKQGLSHV